MLVLLVFLGLPMQSHGTTVSVPGDYPTIGQAAQGAPDGSVIQIAPGRYHEQIELQNVTRTLLFRGNAADPSTVVIDGDGVAAGVVRIHDSPGAISFEGLTITGGHGRAGYGGGIWVANSSAIFTDCVVTANTNDDNGGGAYLLNAGGLFQRCTFSGNTAGYLGGGVMLDWGSTVAFEQCRFLGNEAGLTDPRGSAGALYSVRSSPVLVGCLISGNRAKYSAGGIGALSTWDRPRAILTLRDTTIEDNHVVRADPTWPAADGGGMHIEDNVLAVLDRCRVRGNSSNRGGGLNSYRARYEVTDSIIEDNVVDADGTGAGDGGGIFAASNNPSFPAYGPASVRLVRSIVRRNTASHTGGGIFTIGDFTLTNTRTPLELEDSIVAENTSGTSGGGIYVDRTALTITGGLILDNMSNETGGGLFAAGSTTLAIDGTTIAGNHAAQSGGGLGLTQGGTLQMTGARIVGNGSVSAAGAGALVIGSEPGPIANEGTTGAVTASVIADNGTTNEIVEGDCGGITSAVTYTGNTLHTSGAKLYWRPCSTNVNTVAQFNALAGKASANIDAVPVFTSFLAAPATVAVGTPSILAWCTPGGSGFNVDSGVGPLSGPIGTVNVTPAVSTTFTFNASGLPQATAQVNVTCALLGTPVPLGPANGATGLDPDATVLSWYATSGAVAYDVYADPTNDPTTLVAANLTGTSVTVHGLAHGARYHWKVVAKNPSCTTPSDSPMFSFSTCASEACRFVDGFDDGDASDWTTRGAGTAHVVHGRLTISGRGRLTVVPPFPAFGTGSLSLTLTPLAGRREVHILFAYVDARHFRELVVSGTGRLRLVDWGANAARRHQVVKRGRVRLSSRAASANAVALFITDRTVRVSANGVDVLSGTFANVASGTVAVQVVKGTAAIDDVQVTAE